MTRFHSEGEIKKFDQKLKELNKDDNIDISHLKNSLKEDIVRDYHRINVDSAKKKAVIQRMDYDGFHQMVLGADLKGMRPEEIVYLDHKRDEKVLNSMSTKERYTKEVNVLENLFVENSSETKSEYKFKNCSEEDNIINDKLKKLNSIKDEKLKEIIYEIKVLINSMDQKNEVDKLRIIEIFHYIQSSVTLDSFFKNIGYFETKTFSNIFWMIKSSLEIIIELENSKTQIGFPNIESNLSNIQNINESELNFDEINFQIKILIDLINKLCSSIITNINLKELEKASMFVNKKSKEELSNLVNIVNNFNKDFLNVKDLNLLYK